MASSAPPSFIYPSPASSLNSPLYTYHALDYVNLAFSGTTQSQMNLSMMCGSSSDDFPSQPSDVYPTSTSYNIFYFTSISMVVPGYQITIPEKALSDAALNGWKINDIIYPTCRFTYGVIADDQLTNGTVSGFFNYNYLRGHEPQTFIASAVAAVSTSSMPSSSMASASSPSSVVSTNSSPATSTTEQIQTIQLSAMPTSTILTSYSTLTTPLIISTTISTLSQASSLAPTNTSSTSPTATSAPTINPLSGSKGLSSKGITIISAAIPATVLLAACLIFWNQYRHHKRKLSRKRSARSQFGKGELETSGGWKECGIDQNEGSKVNRRREVDYLHIFGTNRGQNGKADRKDAEIQKAKRGTIRYELDGGGILEKN